MPAKLQSRNTKTAASGKKSKKAQSPEDVVRGWQEEERENLENLEFIQAIDRFKRRSGKSFPTWTEVLQILRDLGYRKETG